MLQVGFFSYIFFFTIPLESQLSKSDPLLARHFLIKTKLSPTGYHTSTPALSGKIYINIDNSILT